MFQEPVLVFGASPQEMSSTAERARSRGAPCSVFTRDLINTFNDSDNRAAVAAVPADRLDIVGLTFRCVSTRAENILKGLRLLRRGPGCTLAFSLLRMLAYR